MIITQKESYRKKDKKHKFDAKSEFVKIKKKLFIHFGSLLSFI